MAKIVEGLHKGRDLAWLRGDRIVVTWKENFQPKREDITGDIVNYYVADESHRVAAGAGAAAAGAILLGPLGLAGGLLAAKKKRLGVITYRDGQQSLVEIKDKKVHETLVKVAIKNGIGGK